MAPRRTYVAVGGAAFLAAALALTAAAVLGQGGVYDLSWSSVDGGGGDSFGGRYALGGTIGQPDAGEEATGGSHGLVGGFRAVESGPGEPPPPPAPSQYGLSWSSVDGGGGASSGGRYGLGGTIGQHDAGGELTGGGHGLLGGFWAGAAGPGEPPPVPSRYGLSWFNMDGGGGDSSGGRYALGGTIGQHDAAGEQRGGGYVLLGGFWPGAAVPAAVPPEPIVRDLNGDGKVDGADLLIVTVALGTSPPSDDRADVNRDGRVDVRDLAEIGAHFGTLVGPIELAPP